MSVSKSPYGKTPVLTNYFPYLDVWVPPTITVSDNDEVYTIESKYNERPDLLAYDLYGSSKVWWIFMYRNPDVLIDGVSDFLAGKEIFIPNKRDVDKL